MPPKAASEAITMTKEFSETVATKVSSATSDALTACAAEFGVTRGELVRRAIQALLGEAVPELQPAAPVFDPSELRRLMAELGRHGSLLNQIARTMNIGGATPAAQASLIAIEAEYRRVLEAIRAVLKVPE